MYVRARVFEFCMPVSGTHLFGMQVAAEQAAVESLLELQSQALSLLGAAVCLVSLGVVIALQPCLFPCVSPGFQVYDRSSQAQN